MLWRAICWSCGKDWGNGVRAPAAESASTGRSRSFGCYATPCWIPTSRRPIIPAPSPAKERDWAGGENETSDLPRPVPESNWGSSLRRVDRSLLPELEPWDVKVWLMLGRYKDHYCWCAHICVWKLVEEPYFVIHCMNNSEWWWYEDKKVFYHVLHSCNTKVLKLIIKHIDRLLDY